MRTRNSQYGFFPASGTDYTYGQEPEIARRLDRLGKSLRMHLIGISGYRTPAHSVAVGGFANDPHTHGQASDTPGIESVSETVLRRFGLTRPFGTPGEADHIQLLGGARGTTRNMSPRGSGFTIGELWTQAGGPRNLAPIMAAIGMAESGGRVDAVGGPNTDGSYDYGLFQINSSHSQYDVNKLVSDPLYNARAAVAIWRSQGLGAWSTYNNGAYRTYMGQRTSVKNAGPGRVRPGGSTDSSTGIDTAFADYLQESDGAGGATTQNVGFLDGWHVVPGFPLPLPNNPLKIFEDGKNAITGTADFLKWIAWIFHPRNILRAVEFVTGLTFVILGIHTAIQVHQGAEETAIGKTARRVKRAPGKAVAATPAGRELRLARGARAGRQAARAQSRRIEFQDAYKRGKRGEGRKQKTRRNEREMDKKYGGVPF